MTTPTPTTPGAFAIAIATWARRRNLWNQDYHWYTQQEWQARGEPYGNSAPITLTLDGAGLGHLLNGYYSGNGAQRNYEEFTQECERHGYWWELGFSWSLHFYPYISIR